jgi:Baseplate J-like protein
VAVIVPSLDDRTFADLVREGLELIPAVAPEWTNHNASDPGITLVELFAYLTEIYLYRVDRISAANKAKFLKLLTGGQAAAAADRQLYAAVSEMRRITRAITAEDFEQLALEAVRTSGMTTVMRVHTYPCRNLEPLLVAERQRDRPGHVSVVFVPSDRGLADKQLHDIALAIRNYLEPRRLLTCRVHVVAPRYIDAAIRLRVAAAPSRGPLVEGKVRQAVNEAFQSWPLGRGVYTSDLYRTVGSIDGVLRTLDIEWTPDDPARLIRNETGEVMGLHLYEGELPRIKVSGISREVSS